MKPILHVVRYSLNQNFAHRTIVNKTLIISSRYFGSAESIVKLSQVERSTHSLRHFVSLFSK